MPPMPSTIMVVEDDLTIAGLIKFILSSEGFHVETFPDGRQALDAFDATRPDLVVLDLMMPGMNGFEFAQAVRARAEHQRLPILVVTASNQMDARYEAFQAGADDFLTKPFDARELLFRVKAFLRLTGGQVQGPLSTGVERKLQLDTATMMATVGSRSVQLTPLETLVLQHLMAHPDRIMSADDIATEVLAAAQGGRSADAAQAHVKNLRAKLEEDPAKPTMIVTVGRRGYRYMGA
ncbi:MAG: response regulator with CheY-like receiver domain and winged-helix DNA-binding domain [Cyanobacteria bacterium RYN_339]|nr:response regulator with CheY-like receiver domain and winged-helix DNA-binding domain [Cyanobacteria bacterium RYN_339]